jgi:hypothetical protein
MRRNRITLGALASLALFAIQAPAALAGGPLLSGYGGPGAGAQAIIGGTLLNGPKGGPGGGSGGSPGAPSSPSSSLSSSSPVSSSSATSASHHATGGGAVPGSIGGRGSSGARRYGGEGAAAGRGTSAGSAGTYSSQTHPEASMTASVSAGGSSWFSGGDLLALVLVAGVLALVAVATVRLSGMGAHHE